MQHHPVGLAAQRLVQLAHACGLKCLLGQGGPVDLSLGAQDGLNEPAAGFHLTRVESHEYLFYAPHVRTERKSGGVVFDGRECLADDLSMQCFGRVAVPLAFR